MSADPRRFARAVLRLAPGVERLANDEGGWDLRGPLLRRRLPWRILSRWLRLPARAHVRLDAIGSLVVERLDGRDLVSLAAVVAGELRLTRREAEAGVTSFIRLLLLRRLVVLDEASHAVAPAIPAMISPPGSPA
jgi:hypothetical protein